MINFTRTPRRSSIRPRFTWNGGPTDPPSDDRPHRHYHRHRKSDSTRRRAVVANYADGARSSSSAFVESPLPKYIPCLRKVMHLG